MRRPIDPAISDLFLYINAKKSLELYSGIRRGHALDVPLAGRDGSSGSIQLWVGWY